MNLLFKLSFLVISVSGSQYIHADTDNFFNKKRTSSEALTAGVEGCKNSFTKDLKRKNAFTGTKAEQLSIHHYCSCMMDAIQSLGQTKGVAQREKCMSYAKESVDKYLAGDQNVREQNLFDPLDIPSSSVYLLQLLCTDREKKSGRIHKKFSESLYCSCQVDNAREDKNFQTNQYIQGGDFPQDKIDFCYEKSKARWVKPNASTEKPIEVPKEPSDLFAAKGKVESKDGWETFKIACVSKFKGKEKLSVVTQKCIDMINAMRSNQYGIAPYSAGETDQFPKLRKGMTKSDLLQTFGKPISVSDDGQAIRFKSKIFCKSYNNECVVYFFKPGEGASSWSDFKFEFTDNLRD